MVKPSHKKFQNLNDITLGSEQLLDFSVERHGIKLECRLNKKLTNEYLIVAPNGAVDRSSLKLPVFARWNWHGLFKSSILSISDPTLYLADDLPIAWFAGTKYQDTTEYVADVVMRISTLLEIPYNRIIFWGSSAGGFASMLIASRIDGAGFVSVNGQTQICKYHPRHVELYRKVFDPSSSLEELTATYPERWSTMLALEKSYDLGKETNGVIVQNIVDKDHYIKHFTPFCEYFKLSNHGSLNSDLGLHSFVYSHDKGHGPAPSEVVKEIVKIYFPKIMKLNSNP